MSKLEITELGLSLFVTVRVVKTGVNQKLQFLVRSSARSILNQEKTKWIWFSTKPNQTGFSNFVFKLKQIKQGLLFEDVN